MKWTSCVLVAALCGLLLVSTSMPASAADIAWVTFHPADNMPSTGAAGQGFTEAPDKGYTDLLTANGHTVTRFQTHDSPTPADLAILSAADLVIIGRSVNSGHYGAADETLFWNTTLTKPVIGMGAYGLRGPTNTRLGWYVDDTIPDTAGPIKLTVNNPAHPIFAGIALDGSNTMVNDYAGIVTMPVGTMTVQRGISTITDPLVAGAQLLATVGTAGDPTNGGAIIAHLPPGTTTTTGVPNVLGGHRLVFLSGSREHASDSSAVPPLTTNSEIAGIFDLSADGAQMFLNAVDFMVAIPEPSTASLLLLAVAGLGLLRKR